MATDPLGSVAFSLGWQVAELYGPAPTFDPREAAPHALPDVGSLAIVDRRSLRFLQIDSALTKLGTRIEEAGRTVPRAAEAKQKAEAGDEDFSEAVRRLHVELLITLTAADFRLGKAYGLGRALYETCNVPSEESLHHALAAGRVGTLYSWLLDLKSVLPDHAGECVYQSLKRWERWDDDKRVDGERFEREPHHERLRHTLSRQGEIWRALLSGEKQATDTLTTAGYVEAAKYVFRNGAQLLGRLPSPLWVAIGIALLIAVGGLIAAAITGNISSVIATLGGLAAVLGISLAGVKNALGTAAARLREPLWGAALDCVIVDAITRVGDLAEGAEVAAPATAGENRP